MKKMNIFNNSMRFFNLALLLIMLLGVNTQAWGQWNSTLTATASPSEGGGVCATKEDKSSLNDSDYGPSSTSGKTYCATIWSTATFYAYYKTKPGYKFNKWSTGATSWKISVKADRSNKHPSVTAYFSPITYKIVFNGNNKTSGSMDDLTMTYNTAKNLTAYGFSRAYTVKYDANGGSCDVSSATATYKFNGWNTNSAGTGTAYSDKANVNNLTTTDGATINLYAQWTSKSVTLPNATKAGYVLDGWYAGDTKVGEAGGSYTPTANVTLKAKWIDKHTPVMTGANTSMMVDGVQENAFTFNHVDGQVAHITVKSIDAINNGDGKVIEYDATNNKITAHNAGVAEIYFTQAETSTIKSGTSATYTYTVHKYNSAFAGVADLSTNVDADVESAYTLNYSRLDAAYIGVIPTAGTPTEGVSSTEFYYTLDHEVTATNTENSANGSLAITYNAGNKTATGKNAGTGTIHLRQPETYKYKAASADIKVTVTKNDPVFTWKNGPYYHNSSVSNVFTSTNKDLAFTIGASTNPNVAYETGNTLYILTKAGTANFTVSQPENYKWNSKSVTYSVAPENPSNHVTFTYTQAMYNDGSITVKKEGTTEWTDSRLRLGGSATGIFDAPAYNNDDKYVDIAFKGIPEKVTFEIATNSDIATGEYWYVKESSDGINWSGEKWNSEHEGTGYASFSVSLSQTARYIRLCYSGNFAGYFRNITIHELKKFTPNPSSLAFGTHPINETCASQTFAFNYANVGHNVTLATNDSHFTVTPTKITNIGGEKVGSTTVTVSYSTAEAHKSSGAKITITDELGNSAMVNLSGETKRLDPTITWSPDDATFNVDDELTALNANELEVTLSVAAADEAYVHCVGNTATMIGAKTGTVVVTAHVTGNNIYNDKDFTKEISITNLTKQYITWEQDFSRLKTTDGTKSITLNATASSGLPVSYELVGDKTGLTLTQSGETWTLTYSASECKNTTIVAKQGGNETYAPASSVSKQVKVIDPSKVCDTNETLVNSTVTLKETSVTYNIDIPQSMTIEVSRTKTSWAIYSKGFKVEFYSGRNGTGTKLHEYSYGAGDIDKSKTISLSGLNIAAQSVKLISDASNGYNVNSVTYTKRKYCDLSKSSLSFETYPNTVTMPQTVDVSYANYPITVECSNDKFSFDPKDFGDCSEYGTKTITVTYSAGASAGTDEGYLYIKDNTGAVLRTCTLSVTIRPKVEQSITSNNIGSSYKTTDKVTLTASTNSGLSNFTYSAAPAGVAVINGAEMTFTQSGTIAVTVSEPGNKIYNATSETVENIVVSKDVPNISTLPVGTAVTYLQKLSSSTLSGGAAEVTLRGAAHTTVAGAFAWTEPEHVISENAGAHKYGVTFTPEDGGMYTNATCQVEIVVNRASQALEMKNGAVLVAVGGIDAGKADSKLDLNSLIVSQTQDPVAANRAGAVTYEVISANKEKATISDVTTFSATEIGDYTIRATKAQTDYYNVATAEFTVTVAMRPNTMVTAGSYTKYVDDMVETVATLINSDGKIHTSSTDATIAYYDIAENKIHIPNSEAKSFDQTEITIKIWQDATPQFEGIPEAEAKTITLTVKKYDNQLSYTWGGANQTSWRYFLNFDQREYVVFSTNNTNYSAAPIIISQTSGSTVAKYYPELNAIHSAQNVGTATWSVSQAETYKYKAPETKIFTVTVGTVASECYVLNDQNTYELHTIDKESPLALSGPGDQLTFDARKNTISIDYGLPVQYSTDGTNFRDLTKIDLTGDYKPYGPFTLPEGTTHILFKSETGSTLVKYYKNIKVTRKKWFSLQDVNGTEISEITMPLNTVGENSKTATFYVDYSTCADVIKVVSNHQQVTVSENEFYSNGNGKKAITITYTVNAQDRPEEISATITVYTPNENKTLLVHAQTVKQTQTINWAKGYDVSEVSLPVGLNDATPATASSGLTPVIYTTNNSSVIQIAADGQSFSVIGTGTATLTASQAGDKYKWNAVSDTKTINATDKKIQVIRWEQDFTRSIAPGDVKELLAEVYVNNALAGVQTKSDERTAMIRYSCPDGNGVISVSGDQMTVFGYGVTSVTASIEGDENYESATMTLLVRVRAPSTGCEDPIIVNHTEQIQIFSMDIDWTDWTTPPVIGDTIFFDAALGKPDKLSFMHEGEEYSIPYISSIKVYRGAIKVQQRVNGNWSDVAGSEVTPAKYQWNLISDLQLDENADAIRFVRLVRGQGYHNIKDVQVTLLQYLRADKETINLGNVQAGATLNAAIGFNYSNLKGDLTVTKTGADGEFLAMDETIEMDCGAHGHYDFPITFAPTRIGEWENDVTITDPISSKTITVHLVANVIRGSQSIQWNPEANICYAEPPLLNATATSGLAVSYAITAGADVAHIENGEVIIDKRSGSFTITASQTGDKSYFPAENVAKTFVMNPVALTLTAPMASDITYPAELGTSELTGGLAKAGDTEISGTWAWKEPASIPTVGDAQAIAVVFTPDERECYYTNFETTALINVKRTQFVYDGSGDGEGDEKKVDWCKVDNWKDNEIPTISDEVLVQHDVVIACEVYAYSVEIEEGKTITIAPNGGLTVGAGGIKNANKDNLILKAGTEGDTKGQTGYLRISPEYTGAMPEATVEMYSIGYYDKTSDEENIAAWQYVGTPIDFEGELAKTVFTRSWIYSYVEATDTWVNNRKNLVMEPFVGYSTTQYDSPDGKLISYSGKLIDNKATITVDLAYTDSEHGENVVANSYTAPIDITNFEDADFVNLEKVVYLFNTGSRKDAEKLLTKGVAETTNAPGQYLPIPIGSARAMKSSFGTITTISPMQGFSVKANTKGAKLTFDYNKLVWNGTSANAPLRVKARNDEASLSGALCISIWSNGWTDNLYMIESDEYAISYENGYDATKQMSGAFNVFAIEDNDQLSVDATNSLIGTRVGVRTGDETAYTFVFSHLQTEDGLALFDAETDQTIDINEGTEYTFFAEPNVMVNDRFRIIERAEIPAITTGVGNVKNNDAKAVKFIKEDQIYILKNGVLYNATGAVVRK